MGKQSVTRSPFLLGVCLALVIAVFGIASAAASAREAGMAGLTLPPALPARLQSTPTATATIRSIPSVVIVSPAAEQKFTFGELVPVVSKSADPQGITRLDQQRRRCLAMLIGRS